MNTTDILNISSDHLRDLIGHTFDVLAISKPTTIQSTINLSKITSKLSPLVGNLIEFNTVEFLNSKKEFKRLGKWIRQDPGFPDTIFKSHVNPAPGFEIKAWFPLATEITARFKDSQDQFREDETNVCILAWLPDQLIFGKPKILDVCIVSGKSVAKARDNHYHNPPDYLVIEPEDTSTRTKNLQQTNTSGHKFQGTKEQFHQATEFVRQNELQYNYETSRDYQSKIRELISAFPYRLDTNFAKIDRIFHEDIELFKRQVLDTEIQGNTIKEWNKILNYHDDSDENKLNALGKLTGLSISKNKIQLG